MLSTDGLPRDQIVFDLYTELADSTQYNTKRKEKHFVIPTATTKNGWGMLGMSIIASQSRGRALAVCCVAFLAYFISVVKSIDPMPSVKSRLNTPSEIKSERESRQGKDCISSVRYQFVYGICPSPFTRGARYRFDCSFFSPMAPKSSQKGRRGQKRIVIIIITHAVCGERREFIRATSQKR